jgi:hypothetical protein
VPRGCRSAASAGDGRCSSTSMCVPGLHSGDKISGPWVPIAPASAARGAGCGATRLTPGLLIGRVGPVLGFRFSCVAGRPDTRARSLPACRRRRSVRPPRGPPRVARLAAVRGARRGLRVLGAKHG